jgi:hypothetical protein
MAPNYAQWQSESYPDRSMELAPGQTDWFNRPNPWDDQEAISRQPSWPELAYRQANSRCDCGDPTCQRLW